MVTANTPTAVRSTEPASDGSGRCSRANGAIMSWQRAGEMRPKKWWRPWKGLPTTAACFQNKSGIRRIFPQHQLFFGRPSGSAMPLVWAHAEYVKLRRSLEDGKVFDMPTHTVERYLKKQHRLQADLLALRAAMPGNSGGKYVAIGGLRQGPSPLDRRPLADDSRQCRPLTAAWDCTMSIWHAKPRGPGDAVQFTFYWSESDRWEGQKLPSGSGRRG